MIKINAFSYSMTLFLIMNVDVPTIATEVHCQWTVALCLDVTILNVVWIAIGGHCGVRVHWWSSGNEMHITVQCTSIIHMYNDWFDSNIIYFINDLRWIWSIC